VVRSVASAIALGVVLLIPLPVLGQQSDANASSGADEHRNTDLAKFLAGAGLKFVIHESGHLVFDEIFDAHPHVRAVHFGPFPFFAITPRRPLSSRQLFTVASTGFLDHGSGVCVVGDQTREEVGRRATALSRRRKLLSTADKTQMSFRASISPTG
jgi:hypothetical protein